jgi:phage baseplate assembly protein W
MDATDIQLDNNEDLLVINEDLLIGLSDDQHIEDILITYPGEYKQSPLCGVNIRRALNGSIDGSIRRDVRLNLEGDGYQVDSVTFTEEELKINAKRT